jgi:glycosyltransferase involved in cell wall biosynthesis
MIIVDVATTDQGAYRLLRTRVSKIDRIYSNIIACPKGEYFHKMASTGIKVVPCNIRRELDFFSLGREISEIKNMLLEINPDIVHSHNSKTGALVRLAVRSLNIRRGKTNKIIMIHQVHGYHHTLYTGFKRLLFQTVEVFLTRYTDVLIFQNKYEYELTKQYPISKKCSLNFIGNGINFEEIKDVRAEARLEKSNKIVCVARIEPVKNHDMLVEIADVMVNKYNFHAFEFQLIGEGNKDDLMDKIKERNLSKYFEFTGALDREDVLLSLSQARVSILTSFKEGLPRAIVEALVLKTPCIGTDVIGTNEVIEHEKNGFLIPLTGHEMGARYIIELLTNDVLWQEMSDFAYKSSIEKYDEDKIIEKLIDVYKVFE